MYLNFDNCKSIDPACEKSNYSTQKTQGCYTLCNNLT